MNKRQRSGHGRPTLHNVAQAAGVTRITVSRYLRTPHLLAPDTAARVREAIEQIGYVPNQQAGQLASGRSRIVAALVPNLGYSVFAESVQGLSEGLRGSGYELMLMSTGYSLQREEEQLRSLLGWSPSALVLTGRRHTPAALKLLRDAQQLGVPVVEIWDRPAAQEVPEDMALIGFDHRAIGGLMAEHLVRLGHRRIAYVESALADDYRARERRLGFAAAVRAAKAQVAVCTAPEGDAFEAGRGVLDRLRVEQPGVTAIAASNDVLAAGVVQQAVAVGVAVPQQLSVLGYGDFPISRQLRPSLSTVHTPNVEIGRSAAEALLAALRGDGPARSLTLECSMLVRDSTGPVPPRIAS